MPRKPVIIFDLDGTLIESAPAITRSTNAMLGDLGLAALSLGQVRFFMGDGVEKVVERALSAAAPSGDIDHSRAFQLFLNHHEQHGDNGTSKIAGADDLLSALTLAGYDIALCTNKIARLTIPLLDHIGWSETFRSVVCGDTLDAMKPDPRVLLDAIEASGHKKAIFVDDTHVDVATAKAAGVPFILVDNGHRSAGLDAASCRTAAGLGMVLEIVDSLSREAFAHPGHHEVE